jgi:hypothetical protein
MNLLTSQRNDIFREIEDAGLDPGRFEWQLLGVQNFGPTDTLRCSATPWLYEFRIDEAGRHFARFSPGSAAQVEHQSPGSWQGQLRHFSAWLRYVSRELEAPDLWADFDRYRLPTPGVDFDDLPNEPFTVPQVETIERTLGRNRDSFLAEVGESKVHRRIVEERLAYLSAAARRQGKRDWAHTAIGVLVTLSVSVALDPDRAVEIWHELGHALAGVLQLLPNLPPN